MTRIVILIAIAIIIVKANILQFFVIMLLFSVCPDQVPSFGLHFGHVAYDRMWDLGLLSGTVSGFGSRAGL